MSANAPRARIEVVAAVLQRPDSSFLLAQRPEGKVYAGYWEFPGGKVEPGEAPRAALARELNEELGITVEEAWPWITRDYDYEHALVRLRFFRVTRWSGELHGRERQSFAWQAHGALTASPLLPANGPILRALALPALYAISNAADTGVEVFLRRLERALANGLRLIQVREKALDDATLLALTGRIARVARPAGAKVLLNAAPALAARAGVDGVHLTASRLMAAARRPDFELVGASCHDERELARAAEIGVDFVVVGAIKETTSHPGTPALGWERCAALLADYPLPAYAVGGLSAADLPAAWRAGAHGVAAIRAAWSVETNGC